MIRIAVVDCVEEENMLRLASVGLGCDCSVAMFWAQYVDAPIDHPGLARGRWCSHAPGVVCVPRSAVPCTVLVRTRAIGYQSFECTVDVTESGLVYPTMVKDTFYDPFGAD
jgi:hypothetical protein